MNDKELMDFVEWLPNNSELFTDMDVKAIIDQINDLASSDEGKETLEQLTKQYKNKEMGIFKEGGKLNYLLCLKKGGAIQDCGCGKKIEKNQPGGSIASRIWNRLTGNDTYVDGGGQIRHYAPVRESAHRVIKRAADSPLVQVIPVVGDIADGYIAADYAAKGDYKPAMAAIGAGLILPNVMEAGIHMVPGSTRRKAIQKAVDEFEDNTRRWIPEDVYDDVEDIVGSQRSNEPWWGWDPIEYQKGGEISRRGALTMLRTTGSSNSESRKEYRDAKRDARESGLRGKEMRQAARNAAMTRGIDRIIPALDDVEIEEIPISFEDPFANIEVPTSLGISIMDKIPVTPNDVIGGSFKEAFAEARKRGLKDFVWDNANAKYSRYSTALANSSKKRQEPEIITSSTPSYPVYIAPKDSGFGEKIKMAIINNAPYMK